MKKEWKELSLEKLDVEETFAGPGIRTPDDVQPDPDEMIHFS
ncbi:paeninodin family lasso peptide [Jeotgalibacillus malaysiensis]